MDGTSEFEVTAETERQMIEMSFQRPDRQKVGQGLRRMLVSAVSRIDDGNQRFHGSDERSALLGMPHGSDIRVTGNNAHSIGNALPFGG